MALALVTAAALPAQQNPDPARFQRDIEAFQSADREKAPPVNAIVFVGSSSIRLWPAAERFPDLPVLNRGFGGSHISDVLHYLDQTVLRYSPRVVVFYAGDNDIAGGKSPERVFADFRTFCERVHEKLPETRVVWLPIKPSLARWNQWSLMQQANSKVAEYARQQTYLSYADTASPMLGADGRPKPELFIQDGLHMTPAGYDIWSSVLKAHLETLPGK